MNTRRRFLLAAGALACAGTASAYDLDEVRKRGLLRVAVYKEFAPFSDNGRGVDVDIAAALAAALEVKVAMLPFDADENVDDDLRNMVWRGHYLGYGPADVMLHVPVDPVLAERNKRVTILAPYYREKLQIARNTTRIPRLMTLTDLLDQPIGVEGSTLGSTVLLGTAGGRLRDGVRHYRSIAAALDELKAGKLAAVVGQRSELHAGLHATNGFEIGDFTAPGVPTEGWALGLAVRREDAALGRALGAEIERLIDSGAMAQIFQRHKIEWLRP